MAIFEEGDFVHPIGPDREPHEVGVVIRTSEENQTAQVMFIKKRFLGFREKTIIERWPIKNLWPAELTLFIPDGYPNPEGVADGM